MMKRRIKIIDLLLTAAIAAGALSFISGCKKKGEEVIKIGAILPLTGDMAKYGKTSLIALEMARDEINNQLKSNKYKIELIIEDDQLKSNIAVSAINKLIKINKVNAVIGPMASSITLAIAPIAEKNKIVLLSPGSSSPLITNAGDYIFRNCVSDLYEGIEMAIFVKDSLKIINCAILYINNDFGKGLENVFKKQYKTLGGNITLSESYEEGSTDFRSCLIKIQNSNPQAVYLIGYKEMVNVFYQTNEIKFFTQWLGTTMLNDQYIIDQTRGAANNCIFASWEYDINNNNPKLSKFITEFIAKSRNITPDVFAANTYDALYLIYEAIIKKSDKSEDIKNMLYTIQNYPGITGLTSFDKNGDVKKRIVFKKVIDGNITNF